MQIQKKVIMRASTSWWHVFLGCLHIIWIVQKCASWNRPNCVVGSLDIWSLLGCFESLKVYSAKKYEHNSLTLILSSVDDTEVQNDSKSVQVSIHSRGCTWSCRDCRMGGFIRKHVPNLGYILTASCVQMLPGWSISRDYGKYLIEKGNLNYF